MPPLTTVPPVPEISPAKVVLPLLNVRVCAPKVTPPLPDKVTMDAPLVVPEISKVPLLTTSEDVATLPVPVKAKVEDELIFVVPVKVLVPLKVCVPPETVIPPVPLIPPPKVVLPLVKVKVWLPRLTAPLPDNVLIDAPLVVAEISNVPLLVTCEDVAMDPLPLKLN